MILDQECNYAGHRLKDTETIERNALELSSSVLILSPHLLVKKLEQCTCNLIFFSCFNNIFQFVVCD